MTPLGRRVASLESARHPNGYLMIGGKLMNMAGAINFFRGLAIGEAERIPLRWHDQPAIDTSTHDLARTIVARRRYVIHNLDTS